MLKRRLCDDPKADSSGANGCPDLWELEDGSFLVVGADRTDELKHLVGDGLYLDEHERMIVIPRRTLVSARTAIPRK